jgi:hypothetical protein
MKYLCLGYHDDAAWSALSDADRAVLVEETLAYGRELRAGGHVLSDTALQGPATATTLRFGGGMVRVTDGPFAETKEQLGGVMILEAKDLNHAVQLMSRIPCMRLGGSLEIRPINEDIKV